MATPDARMVWLLQRMTDPYRGSSGQEGYIVAWDRYTVDAFVKSFPEANKRLVVYTMGQNSCPMLNAAANRAKTRGLITPGVIGNQDARTYNQRT